MNPHWKDNGFTILEILIVLSIFLILIGVSVPLQSNSLQKLEDEKFLQAFEEDILLMQSAAITNGSLMKLTFFPQNHYYEIREGGFNHLIKRRSYSSRIKIDLGTFTLPFSFYPSGTPNQPGSFTFTTDYSKYKITFPFGKGRFYVTKQ
ncbi:competence type IV pilus minor pilin ComGD [Salirhabdus sp. Marseille-P4669]|uniref:competence type IV pilus minor pilin ComGD n=1 Tax=Salirhabdus sp. Marseille-P4669 TaxID=2042310 RepID=UPI000C7E0A9F|nr:competence type IV pilus minor pilin ComGD [Salirhabdus sp. Marseille-P4669]